MTALFLMLFISVAHAADPAPQASAAAPAPPPPAAAEAAPAAPKVQKGRASREKEAEGTEAPNRFKTDTVIKSQYKLNGQELEVDPN